MARPRRDQNSRMLHVKDRWSLNFQFGAFSFLVLHTVVFLALIHSCRGQSQVVGPPQPIVATVGEDIILPCYLDPVVNAFDMTLEWARPDLNPRYVLVWRHSVEMESIKHPSYEGRTSMFTNELQHGNISLKLSKVKISDEGTYRCFLLALDRSSTVQLVVGAASSPVIQEIRNSRGELECESEGWYPEPEVFWLDGEGHLISAGPTETVRGPDGLYAVSSRVTVEKGHGNRFTCRVQQKTINQTRETQIHVPDHFFILSTPSSPGSRGSPGSPHVIIGSIIGCAALVFFPAVVFVVWKWRLKKIKNKKRSCEDGAEQKTFTSTNDNTGFQVRMEGRESVPLMAGREEEQNNVDNRGEEKIESQSEHKDLFVAERETHQDQQPEPIRDMDGAEGERKAKSINNEKVPLIPAKGKTQKQGMIGRQVKSDCDKGEGEQTMKPVKKDSGLPIELVAERQKEQPQNVHTDQKVKKEEETRQEPMNDVDKKETKVKKKRAKKGGSGLTGQKEQQENQTERMQERQKVENERKLQSEMQTRKEREKDEIELKPQTGNGNQHVLEEKKQERSTAEPEDKKGKGREGNQSNITRTTDRKAENQKEQINEKMKETEEKRDVRENKPPSVSREVTERPDLRIHQETTGRKNQEATELQAEKPEETSQRNQEETKDQPERSTKGVKIERQEEGLETDKGDRRKFKEIKQGDLQTVQQPYVKEEIREKPEQPKFTAERAAECQEVLQEEAMEIDESRRKFKEIRQEGQQQTVQQLYLKEEIREKQEESKFIAERAVECLEILQEEAMEIDESRRKSKEIRQGQLQTVQQLYLKEEIRKQPEESSKFLTEKRNECQEVLQEEPMQIYETQKKSEEIRQEGQQQTVQQLYLKEEIRQKPEESSKFLTEGGAECQEVLQEEPMDTDTKPDNDETQRKVKIGEKQQRKQEEEPNVDQGETVQKRRRLEEGKVLQTEKTKTGRGRKKR